MTNLQNLSQQMTAYLQLNPTHSQTLWQVALRNLDPAVIRQMADRLGGNDTMGNSLRQQLDTLANERETMPYSLGPK